MEGKEKRENTFNTYVQAGFGRIQLVDARVDSKVGIRESIRHCATIESDFRNFESIRVVVVTSIYRKSESISEIPCYVIEFSGGMDYLEVGKVVGIEGK